MKKITKIWRVGLVVMVLAGLLAIAAPVSAADPLQFNTEVLPGVPNATLVAGSDVYDFAVSSDGKTVLAVGMTATNNSTLWKSLDAGRTWVDISANQGYPATQGIQYIAIAPDSASIVVVAGTNNVTGLPICYASTNGGSNWTQLGTTVTGGGGASVAINGLAISSSVPPGVRYVALPGKTAAYGAVFYFNLGAASPVWADAVLDFGPPGTDLVSPQNYDEFWALAFSPNFSADYTAVAVSSNATTPASLLQLHNLGFNQKNWNAFTGYPVTVFTSTATMTVNAVDIALAPDYVGNDDVSRVSFVGFSATAGGSNVGGIYRTDDNNPRTVRAGTNVSSIAYNGTNLVAGSYADNVVWRSADPLTSTPTVSPSRSNKRIGIEPAGDAINDRTVVAYNGDEVLGAKRGVQSAFSVSMDDGLSWNDVSLIDTALTNITDFLVVTDGSKKYLATNDGTHTSIFRGNPGPPWQRVLTLPGADGYILRGSPDDMNAIWVADSGATAGTAIYYATDAGQNRWYSYVAGGAITDLAAESKDVVYIATTTKVMKSSNAGFTWGPPVTPELAGNAVMTVISLGSNKLIAGGAAGFVSYSLDGNATWVKIPKPIVGTAGNVQVIADGLDTGNFIYAASSANGTSVYRWTVGDPPSADWKDLGASGSTGTSGAVGIDYVKGALYIATTNGNTTYLIRSLNANAGGGWRWNNPSTSAFATLTPSVLKSGTAGNDITLYFVDTTGTDSVKSYIDNLALIGPSPATPPDKFQDPMNPVTGRAQDITFNWPNPSPVNVTYYEIDLYSDAAARNKLVTLASPFSPGPSASLLLGPFTNPAFEWTPGTTYYWRVRVTTPVLSQWSALRSITVQPGQAMVPIIGSPANGSMSVSPKPAFSWSPVSGATKYAFQLASDAQFVALITDATLATTGIQPASPLEAGKTYFWRVRSLEPVLGEWSAIANFTVATPAPPAAPPVVVTQVPAPVITMPAPPPATTITIPPPEQPAQIAPAYIWAIIIIGAILVIAVIVLIVRTRRTV
ncbi:MAG: hypothetical protein A2144_12730 [Chloroflexi bacterium RBG_16_50_9]|nr:MAG: hypothetical protein A2144_12730 [Chloroflexi bacterium RBG_16_50_9]